MRLRHFILFLATIVAITLASCHDEKRSEKRSDTSSTTVTTTDTTASAQQKADHAVTAEQIKDSGIDKYFTVALVSDSLWNIIQNNNAINRNDLRHIRVLHWDHDNKTHLGEMICHRSIADTLVAIFKELYKERYPIQRMVPAHLYGNDDETQMRDNNTSCYCPRTVKGTRVISKHALGLAVDLNPLYNPYYKAKKDGTQEVQPSTAKPYLDRKKEFSYKIDHNDLAYRIFTSHGFTWGGDWKSCKDYQHFEYRKVN